MWIHPFDTKARILIEPGVLDIIMGYRQDDALKTEAGGIFLGYRREMHLHIVEVTTPQPADKRSLFKFFRRDRHHHNVAVKRWHASSQTVGYLGEWHTHPEAHPNPSSLDMSEWRKICRKEAEPMVFAIIGTNQSPWLGVGFNDCIFRAESA